MGIQQAESDTSEYVIENGQHKGLTLAEVHAAGAKGLTWLHWAIRNPDVPERAHAASEYVRVHEPDLWAEWGLADGHRSSRVPKSKERREEIEQRWHRRVSLQMFAKRFAENSAVDAVLADLFYYSAWASPTELLAAVDLNEGAVNRLLDALVRVVVLKEMPYDEYLQTEEWKTKAEAAKRRYGGRCALDDRHPAEHAHHRTYARRGREADIDIIPLCAACHSKHHDKRP